MLALSRSFFEYLNSNKIRYCHWKSNCRLNKSLNGETDLDLLVNEKDKSIFESALKRFEFKSVLSSRLKRIPDVEDHLGLDYGSGRLIHLHVHYKLVLGQRHIKNHHLPIEEVVFRNIILRDHVYIPCHEIELLLLVIRANMKLGIDSLLKNAVNGLMGRGSTPYPSDIENEIEGLISVCDMTRLKSLLRESNLPLPEDFFMAFVEKFSKKELGATDAVKWRYQAMSCLKGYRRESGPVVTVRHCLLYTRNLPFIQRMFRHGKKTLPDRGRIISIVGADGSGKSTITSDLNKWLSWKLEVKNVYYGIPKTSIVAIWSLTVRGFNKIRLRYIADLLNAFLCIYIARRRYLIFTKTQAEVEKGRIVITDRFPMKEFRKMDVPMDGPRLQSPETALPRIFTILEERYYNMIELPDRVFVLQVELDELRKRKSDIEGALHRKKAEAVNRVVKSPCVSLIDANRSYHEVLMEVKRKIWELI